MALTELERRARELRDLLYAECNVDMNFAILCELMRPRIWWRAASYVRDMDGYDFEDLYQEACIVIWNIVSKKKPDIHTSVVVYLSATIRYRFADLFYEYALNNVKRMYMGYDYNNEESIGYYHVKEIECVKKR